MSKIDLDSLTTKIHDLLSNSEIPKDQQISNIVDILFIMPSYIIQQLTEEYNSKYNVTLISDLSTIFSSELTSLATMFLLSPVDLDVSQIFKSIDGLGTNDPLLIEIMSTRPNKMLKKIAVKYEELHKESLEKAIKGDTSSDYQKLLVSLLQENRRENPYPNSDNIRKAVDELRGNDENKKIDVENFFKLLSKSSYPEIAMVLRVYQNKFQESVLDIINNTFSGDTKDLVNSIISYICEPGKLWARKINNFKDDDVFRILVSRREKDIDEIKDSYKVLFEKDLETDLNEHYTGNLLKALTLLISK